MNSELFTKNNIITSNSFSLRAILATLHLGAMVFMSSMFLFYKYILVFFPSVISHDLMRFYHINGAQLGNLAACYFYPYIIMQIVAGVLLDKFSPRLLTVLAILLCALSLFCFAKTQTLQMAEFSRALMGFAASFASLSYLKLAADWFSQKYYSVLAGLLASAAMIGALFSTTSLAMYVQLIGWRLTLHYCSLLGLVFAILYWIIVKDKTLVSARVATVGNSSWLNAFTVIKNPSNLLLSIYCGLMFSPIEIFCGLWGIPFLIQSHKLSLSSAADSMSFAFIGLALGSPLVSWVAEKINNRLLIMKICTLLSLLSITIILYQLNIDIYVLRIILFLFGFGAGSFMLGFAIARDINALSLTAFTVAIINSFEAFWSALSDSMIGRYLDWRWTGQVRDNVHIFSTQNYKEALTLLIIYFIFAYLILIVIKNKIPRL